MFILSTPLFNYSKFIVLFKKDEKYSRGERGIAQVEIVIITGHFEQLLATLELTERAAGSGFKITTVVQYALQFIFGSYSLKLHLYVCLLFSQEGMVPCIASVSVH